MTFRKRAAVAAAASALVVAVGLAAGTIRTEAATRTLMCGARQRMRAEIERREAAG